MLENGEIAGYLERVRKQQPGFPSVQLPVFAERDQVAPVTYWSAGALFERQARTRRTLGYDLYSQDILASAMEEARRTVKPTASARIDLAPPEIGDQPGFMIFMPVYQPDPQSLARERRLTGYLFTAFDAEWFLDTAIAEAGRKPYAVRLYDGATEGDGLLAANGSTETSRETVATPLSIANRDLRLVVTTEDSHILAPLSIVTMVFGLAIASLLMLVARLLARQAIEDEARLAFYEEQQSIRDTLTRELNHRVKNTLANVLSMLSLTRRRSHDLDEFANSFEGRIRALSATHDLLTGTGWGTTPIRSVIEAELQHFEATRDHKVVIGGPDVELAPNDALSFGLAIHELTTNAAKFGALSVEGGAVSVTWTLSSDTLARVEWLERGGPPVSRMRVRGFGIELIEKVVAHELRHRVELEFRPEGVRCVMGVPVRQRGEFEIRDLRDAPERADNRAGHRAA